MEPENKPKTAAYNREKEVIDDIFSKKCYEFWTNTQIREYLIKTYSYTEQTAQKYCEKLWKKIRDEVNVDYEQDLANTIQFMEYQIQQLTDKNDSFTRLQWIKELNKIRGLAINRVEVKGTIQHIDTIKLTQILPSIEQPVQLLPEGDSQPLTLPITDLSIEENTEE